MFVGCPYCFGPAEIVAWHRASSMQGAVDVVRGWCIDRHWFVMPAPSGSESALSTTLF